MGPRKMKRSARGPFFKDAQTYQVERILERRTKDGKTEYFVKWVGYPDSVNSWEPEENFVEVRAFYTECLVLVCASGVLLLN
jgi:hypothetical protein